MTKKEMIIDLNNFVKSKLPAIEKEMAVLFAYNILYESKRIKTHDFDPPWDRSGMVFNTQQSFKIDDYGVVGDFLKEYNGVQEASFVSGHGFYHNTYKDEFEDKILEIWIEQLKKYLREFKARNKNILSNILTIDIEDMNDDFYVWDCFYEEIADNIDLQYYVLLEKIKCIKAKEFYKKGEFLAKLRNRNLHQKFQQQEKIQKKEQKQSEKTFKKFKFFFRETYNEEYKGEKILACDYKSYFKEFLDINFSSQEQKLLVKYNHLIVSNSVRDKILFD